MKTLIFVALLAMAPTLAQAGETRTIAMSGHGTVRATPDQADITTGVTTNALTAAGALAANTQQMKSLFDALGRAGITARNIQTVNFSVMPQYNRADANHPARVTGYRVTNQVAVHINDIAKVGATLDALVTAGANDMHGISFSIKDTAALLTQAREQAVADARDRAQTYARAAGASLGPIVSITEDGDTAQPMRAMPMMMMAADAPVPMAAGEENVSARVSIVWEIR